MTKVGHETLLKWFIQPLSDQSILENRLNCVEYFYSIYNQQDLNIIKDYISKIYDIRV